MIKALYYVCCTVKLNEFEMSNITQLSKKIVNINTKNF